MTPEASVVKSITELLDLYHIPWFRMNAFKQVIPYATKDGQARRRVIHGHKAGTADILAAPPLAHNGSTTPAWLWIEAKGPSGKQRPSQVEFEAFAVDRGMHYLLVSDSSTLAQWLKGHGVIR